MRLVLELALIPTMLSLVACSHSNGQRASAAATPAPLAVEVTAAPPVATPTPEPAPTPMPAPSAAPATAAPAAPIAAPMAALATSPPASAAPSPTLVPPDKAETKVIPSAPAVHAALNVPPQTMRYGGRFAAPQDPPRIFHMEISDDAPASGEEVSGKVVTTTNVAAVTVSVAGFSMGMHRRDFGVFTLSYTVPHLPFFLKRWYTLHVTAVTADGRTVANSLPIHVR